MSRQGALGLLIGLQFLLGGCGTCTLGIKPKNEADLVTLIATPGSSSTCSPQNFPANFEFATRIDKAGASTPFTVPAGRVLVVTGFSWVGVGPPNATATVELRAGASAPLVRSSAPCDSIIGRCGGSEVLPTGAVIGAGVPVCLTRSGHTSLTIEDGSLQGYLAPD